MRAPDLVPAPGRRGATTFQQDRANADCILIQGSTDTPTLFDLLPGYLPMPHAHTNGDLDTYVEAERTEKGFWGNMRACTVSLLKA